MKTLLKQKYNLNVLNVEKSAIGAGSDTYFVTCNYQEFSSNWYSYDR